MLDDDVPGAVSFVERVQEELAFAREKYPPFNSFHEAYAVILEEVREFEAEVFRKPEDRDAKRIVEELAQIAAMCQRAAESGLLDVGVSNDRR